MSHFTVTVIGENPKLQLAPYHQFECTGNDNEYVKTIDITDELRKKFQSKKYDTFAIFIAEEYGYSAVEHGKEPDLNEKHKYGYFTLTEKGEVESIFRRTNPNYKWDWYELGGRWSGFFLVKNSPTIKRIDQLRKGDIDFEGMAYAAQLRAEHEYDIFWSIVKDCEKPLPWTHFLETYPDKGVAREKYHAQEAVQAMNIASQDNKISYFASYEDYGDSKENYVVKCKRSEFMSYAYVKDGQWIGKGDMGWFGVSRNETDEEEWMVKIHEMIMNLPDDTLISLYDCHI